ncbi:alpha/beta fold hydrolase [Pseudonocardia acidicola]|uniref:Alpha/beta fold hydrolase n=1 Tax=Pseudonocardia acidicola TaxID=2724939 RepID=A0ABX1SC27_9PSEU|nr:alpha/beta fold hydrolase [Pseudonocardia acidicola]NMH98459.1 alpha/beta fold hydrolase [Pseudonocardia acidicola]
MGQRAQPGTSHTVDWDGPVHYVDFGGDAEGPTVVLVHGLGGSHLNWELWTPLLAPHARVLALDLPGFGRSEPFGRRTTVQANVVVLRRFLGEIARRPAVLVGNSMGGMISIFTAASTPQAVSGLVLLDPALPGGHRTPDPVVAGHFLLYALPFVGERFLWLRRQRRSALHRVRELLEICGVDPGDVPAELVDRSATLVEECQDVDGMDRAFLAAARSLVRILIDPAAYRDAMAALTAPVLLVHGARDRLVPITAAREAARQHPHWRYVELADVGHVPQLQVPDALARQVLTWLDEAVAGDGA